MARRSNAARRDASAAQRREGIRSQPLHGARWRGVLAALGVTVGLGGCDGRFPSGWAYVSGVSSTAATVVWTGADGERASCRAPGGATLGGSATPRGRGLQVVRLEGLAPSTRYVCRLGTAEGTVRFRTAPAADEPFTFAAVGDTGDGSREAAALARDLARAAARPWRIVFLHEPPFTAGAKWVVPGLRRHLEPVIEAGHVDLLLAGHSHLYERAEPMCAVVPGARVLEVVSGGGGANLDPPAGHPNFPRVLAVTHYLRVRVTLETIDVRAVDLSGHVLDHARRRRGESPACRAEGWPAPRDR